MVYHYSVIKKPHTLGLGGIIDKEFVGLIQLPTHKGVIYCELNLISNMNAAHQLFLVLVEVTAALINSRSGLINTLEIEVKQPLDDIGLQLVKSA